MTTFIINEDSSVSVVLPQGRLGRKMRARMSREARRALIGCAGGHDRWSRPAAVWSLVTSGCQSLADFHGLKLPRSLRTHAITTR